MRSVTLTKTEYRIVTLLVVVAIVNFIVNILIPIRTFEEFVDAGWSIFSFWCLFGVIIEILVVAVLILLIRKE